MRNLILAAVLLWCGACGGGSPVTGPATVNGTIIGQSMNARDSVSNVVDVAIVNVSFGGSAGLVLITAAPNACANLAASELKKNAKAIFIQVGTQTGRTISPPSGNGNYTVYGTSSIAAATGNVAAALYVATDAKCAPVLDDEATSGTVRLTQVDANGYSGTFDITFADGSHVTGSFTANKCAALSLTMAGVCT